MTTEDAVPTDVGEETNATATVTATPANASPTASKSTNEKPQQQQQQQQSLPAAVEFEPPLACVRRILKHALPSSTNVGKDASAAFARACGIFIIYLTACANDFAREHKRQTITANDVIAAIKELDFKEFAPDMVAFLESYRATERSKKDAKAKAAAKKAEEKDEPSGGGGGGVGGGSGSVDVDDDDENNHSPPKQLEAVVDDDGGVNEDDAIDEDDDDDHDDDEGERKRSRGDEQDVDEDGAEAKRTKTTSD